MRQTKRTKRLSWMAALFVSLSLLAAACGDDDDDDGGSDGGGDVSGDVFVTGSSTVQPISSRVSELLADENDGINVTVEGPGTGDGFAAFCSGEADISDASRPIDEEEIATCEDAGIEFIELEVAFDGIAVLTSAENEDVECLTTADLYALVGPESEGVDNWSDAQDLASQLGSDTTLPDAPLDITAPGEESGTYDAFIELALGDTAEQRLEEGAITEDVAETTRPDYSSQANDNAIIQGIEGSDSSFGWVGFAFAEEAGDAVKEIEIDAGDACVAPSVDTIADGSYPLSRSLYIYVSTAAVEENPAVEAYVDFYLNDGISAVEEVLYVALPDDRIEASRSRWENRTTGSEAA